MTNTVFTHTGKTRIAGVIGWPVAHSQSPRLHGYWLDKYGVDGAYIPLSVAPGHLAEAIAGLSALGFAGANVTIPHKTEVIPFLQHITPIARQIGAVNTLTVSSSGAITGTNTDAQGFLDNLKSQAPAWKATSAPAAVIGAGGAARAVCAALINAGVPEILLFNRTLEKAAALSDILALHSNATVTPLPLDAATWSKHAGDIRLMVNATALGMVGHPPLDLDLSGLHADTVVADIVYAPLKTHLLAAAEKRGLRTVDGLGMLLHQARVGFAQWFGKMPEITDDLRSFVLSGMQG